MRGLTRQEVSWICADVGNSAVVMLATSLIPVYFASIAPGDIVVWWGTTETIASLIVALLMPILGSLADLRHMKKKFFIGFVGTGAVATLALGATSQALAFLSIYIVSAVCLNASMVFYDALLIDATHTERYDKISAFGYAWGYIGSCIPFVICLGIVLGHDVIGIDIIWAMRLAFAITAVWWVAFSIPLFKNVHQTHFKSMPEHLLSATFRSLAKTGRTIIADKQLRYFMLAFFFYIDGVHTIIKMATTYGADLGIDSSQLVLALLVTQLVAFPSAIIYGRVTPRVGARRMLLVSVGAYVFITFYAALFLHDASGFWFLAVVIGMFQGGIQALSRSAFGKLIPKKHANEYFGFFDIFGKYAAILGTALVSGFTQLTGSSSWGVLSLCILFILGFVLLWKMPEPKSS